VIEKGLQHFAQARPYRRIPAHVKRPGGSHSNDRQSLAGRWNGLLYLVPFPGTECRRPERRGHVQPAQTQAFNQKMTTADDTVLIVHHTAPL